MTTDTGGGICPACRASPTKICAEHHVSAHNHITDEEREMDAKDARIAELEKRVRDIAELVCPGYTEGPPEDAIAMMKCERESLTAALEAEKAARVKAEAAIANAYPECESAYVRLNGIYDSLSIEAERACDDVEVAKAALEPIATEIRARGGGA